MKVEDLTQEHVGRLVRVTNPDPKRFPTVEDVFTDLSYQWNARTEQVDKVAHISRNQRIFPSDDIELLEC